VKPAAGPPVAGRPVGPGAGRWASPAGTGPERRRPGWLSDGGKGPTRSGSAAPVTWAGEVGAADPDTAAADEDPDDAGAPDPAGEVGAAESAAAAAREDPAGDTGAPDPAGDVGAAESAEDEAGEDPDGSVEGAAAAEGSAVGAAGGRASASVGAAGAVPVLESGGCHPAAPCSPSGR
jgi:ribonuclease E